MRIALTGKMRRGKTTAATYLVQNYDFVRVGFADRLKEIVRDLRPDLYIPLSSQHVAKPRIELQNFGQVTKQTLGQTVWFDYAVRRIDAYEEKSKQAGVDCNIVIDDLRFVFEADGVRKHGFVIVKVEGAAHATELLGDRHESELETERINADFYLYNNSALDQLYKNVDLIINDLRSREAKL